MPLHANLVEFDIFTMPTSALPLPRQQQQQQQQQQQLSSSQLNTSNSSSGNEKSKSKPQAREYSENHFIDLESQSNNSDEETTTANSAHLAHATTLLEILSTFLIFLVLALLLTDLPACLPTYLQNSLAATARALPLALCTGFPTAVLFWATLNCVVEREGVEFARANVVFCWLVGGLWGAVVFGRF